jgi:hypothetical protein
MIMEMMEKRMSLLDVKRISEIENTRPAFWSNILEASLF